MFSKRPFLLVFLLALGQATDPAGAGCGSSGEGVIYEMEILSCEPARLRVEEAFAEECYDAAAAQRGLAPPEPVFPEFHPMRWTWARHDPHGGSSLIRTVEWQANLIRGKSGGAVVVQTRMLRIARYPRGGAPAGAWKTVHPPWETERLVGLPAARCGDLVGKKLLFEPDYACCDVIPTSDLDCYLNLTRIRLVEAPPAETPPASEAAQ